MDTLVSTVQRSVDAQMATNHDLLRIQAKQSEISYNLQKAKNGLTLVSLALKSAIGDTSAAEIVAVDTIITINPLQDLDEDISSRPEIQLLEKQIEVRENQIKMQRTESLLTVALLAGYTYYGNIELARQQS